jgi:imidazolonepropionase-like amidohydrolase
MQGTIYRGAVATAVLICLEVAAWRSGPLAQNTATPGLVAITNVTVIDGTGAAPRQKTMLILDGGRIEYVGRVGNRSIPQGAQVQDLPGHFVIPGT